jgi:hypothetical protein
MITFFWSRTCPVPNGHTKNFIKINRYTPWDMNHVDRLSVIRLLKCPAVQEPYRMSSLARITEAEWNRHVMIKAEL